MPSDAPRLRLHNKPRRRPGNGQGRNLLPRNHVSEVRLPPQETHRVNLCLWIHIKETLAFHSETSLSREGFVCSYPHGKRTCRACRHRPRTIQTVPIMHVAPRTGPLEAGLLFPRALDRPVTRGGNRPASELASLLFMRRRLASFLSCAPHVCSTRR